MRQSLFDYVIPVAPPPRLQPNFFARIARTCYLSSTTVVLLWLAICAAVLAAAIFNPNQNARATLEFSGADSAAKNMGILQRQFPNLNALMTFTLSNSDSAQLKLARVNLIAELENSDAAFSLVLAPGAGDYYQNHAMFYYPTDDLKARIDYALSIKPLFAAIASSPTTESLATLVSEVSASITLGRDPQGLDALFTEAAKSVQSLLEGNDRHVDWLQVAGLNFEPQAKEAVVLALPKLGMNRKASEIARAAMAKVSATAGTKIDFLQAKNQVLQTPIATNSARAIPFLALAIIFVSFVFFAAVGKLNLSLLIVLPVLATQVICGAAIYFIYADQLIKFWPVVLGVAICGLQISTRLTFAILETLAIAVGKQSAVMLAYQKQGSGVVWVVCLAMLVWCGWLAITQAPFAIMAAIIIMSLATTLAAAMTLIPALAFMLSGELNWRAADWFLPIYQSLFANKSWRIARKLVAFLAIVVGGAGLTYSGQLLTTASVQVDRNQTVNVLARSKLDAEAAVKKLSTIPEAQSVRWLGAFLPSQAEEKQKLLQVLQKQFPLFRPLSPQDPPALRDQITSLLVSLEEIATSSATRPELQKAAHNFRRSLEILSNTTSNGEVLEFENRIFGAFNLLNDHANALSTLVKPELETLDPRLRTLFVSQQNIFRLEVAPMNGISQARLAQILMANGLAVAHPSLQADSARQVLLINSAMVVAAMLLLGLLTMVFAIRELSGSIASLATAFIAICSVFAMAEISRTSLSLISLLQASSLLVAILVIISTAFLKRQITDQPPPDALHAAEAWLPTMIVAAVASSAGFLNFTPWAKDLGIFAIALCVITSVIAVLLRPITIALRRHGL